MYFLGIKVDIRFNETLCWWHYVGYLLVAGARKPVKVKEKRTAAKYREILEENLQDNCDWGDLFSTRKSSQPKPPSNVLNAKPWACSSECILFQWQICGCFPTNFMQPDRMESGEKNPGRLQVHLLRWLGGEFGFLVSNHITLHGSLINY